MQTGEIYVVGLNDLRDGAKQIGWIYSRGTAG